MRDTAQPRHARRLPGRWVLGIIEHLGDEHAAVFVEGDLDRIEDQRLAGEELDLKARTDVNAAQRFLGRSRRLIDMFLSATRKREEKNGCREGESVGQAILPAAGFQPPESRT